MKIDYQVRGRTTDSLWIVRGTNPTTDQTVAEILCATPSEAFRVWTLLNLSEPTLPQPALTPLKKAA